VHEPVLVAEAIDFLVPERGGLFVDATLGGGGHAAVLLASSPKVRLLGIDRDGDVLPHARERLSEFGDRVEFVERRYDELEAILAERGIARVDGILADLGVSSFQLDEQERGFSFRFEAALDMRMGRSSGPTAMDVLNSYSEAEMERIFRRYGEERRARGIARAIAREREKKPLETTTELRDLVYRAKRTRPGSKEGRVDPATRVFQALRIEVNNELEGLERFLDQAVRLLDREGRLVVISYHSLEDRIVKHSLRGLALGEIDEVTGRPHAETRLIEVLTKKPVRPGDAEVEANPRARSARLRAARRL